MDELLKKGKKSGGKMDFEPFIAFWNTECLRDNSRLLISKGDVPGKKSIDFDYYACL